MAPEEVFKKRVGIEDVARAAGVSITTVSHALSGRGQVAAATRERVRGVAQDLGYSPNRLASGLRNRRSNILGFLADDITSTPFATRIVLGAQEAAAAHDQLLFVVNSSQDQAVESRQLAALRSARIDGVIYARVFADDDSKRLPAKLDNVPSVLLDSPDETQRIPSAIADDVQIGRLATQTLIDAGHRAIAHLTVGSKRRGVISRVDGYEQAMEAAGLVPWVVRDGDPGDSRAGSRAYAAMRARYGSTVTGVFAFNDPMAMGVYQSALRDGFRIPEQLSVVGVDDFEPVAAALMPGLTTVALPHFEMGRWGVTTLLDMLNGVSNASPWPILLPGHLVTRDSVRAPVTEPGQRR